jgi:hypothetical protein
MKITKEFLEKHEACCGQIGKFNITFPKGLRFTFNNLKKAALAELDVGWLSFTLTAKGRRIFRDMCLGSTSERDCRQEMGVESCQVCAAIDIWNLYVDGYMRKSIIKELGG